MSPAIYLLPCSIAFCPRWPFCLWLYMCYFLCLEHSAPFTSHWLPLVDSYLSFISQVKQYFSDTPLPFLPHNGARAFSPIPRIYCHSSLSLSFRAPCSSSFCLWVFYELGPDHKILCVLSLFHTNPTPGTASWSQVPMCWQLGASPG